MTDRAVRATAEDHLIDLALWPADGHCWLAVCDAGGNTLPTLDSPRLDASVIAGIRLDPT